MKTVAKVFNWLTIGFCSFFILIFILFGILFFFIEDGEMFPAGIIFMVYSFFFIPSIVVCAIANNKLKTATLVKDLLPLAIVTLILGNMISGIIMLIMKDEDLLNG